MNLLFFLDTSVLMELAMAIAAPSLTLSLAWPSHWACLSGINIEVVFAHRKVVFAHSNVVTLLSSQENLVSFLPGWV